MWWCGGVMMWGCGDVVMWQFGNVCRIRNRMLEAGLPEPDEGRGG